jgi:hypothetical protein
VTPVGPVWGASDQKTEADRVARLIAQLGHSAYARREAASDELERIGKPALDALRKARAQLRPRSPRRGPRSSWPSLPTAAAW